MSKVVPSQVISFIDEVLPAAQNNPTMRLGGDRASDLAGILSLVRDIPPELIQLSGADYTDFIVGVSGLEYMIRTWESRGAGVNATQKIRGAHPVVLIRRTIAKCPDESPSPATVELAFIADDDFRNSIRSDISAASSSLHNGEWKGATVLAGSATEALLLWAIQDRASASMVSAAVEELIGSEFSRPRNLDPETWNLHQYIEVAAALALITAESADQARLAKQFRNLIHPGRSKRLSQACDRATALSALAAVEHVVRDLQ